MKRALVIGIDDYSEAPLTGCVNDADSVADLLRKNGDGSPNFSVVTLTSDSIVVSADTIHSAVTDLFSKDADTALLFFAGHGIINPETNAGYIVSQDGKKPSWGVTLADILHLANKAYPHVKSSVIILDSCQSGFAGEIQGLGPASGQASVIGNGVTILTASHRNQTASEEDGHGLFTSILLDGLSGGSADVVGRITPASVYSHIDQTLGPWEQRPIYKANVQTFITLRTVAPKIPHAVLRRLPDYFPDPAYLFPLDPSYEPDRENVPERVKHIAVNADHVRIFKELQMCNRHSLVVPVDAEHMYYAAIDSKACRLSALGAHYRKLAVMDRI